MDDTERPTYGALYDVPARLLDQAYYARIVCTPHDAAWPSSVAERWQISVYSETDQLLCVATGFPTAEYARKHCGHAHIAVRSCC